MLAHDILRKSLEDNFEHLYAHTGIPRPSFNKNDGHNTLTMYLQVVNA